jgi:hypothetical protein
MKQAQNCAQRVASHRVQVVGRQHARHEIHGDVHGRTVQRPAAEHHVERSAPERTEASRLRNAAPELLQSGSGAVGPTLGMAVDKHGGIHCAGGRPGNAVDCQPRLLEKPVQHAPGEGPVGPATLERKINEERIAVHGDNQTDWAFVKNLSGRPERCRSWCNGRPAAWTAPPWAGPRN